MTEYGILVQRYASDEPDAPMIFEFCHGSDFDRKLIFDEAVDGDLHPANVHWYAESKGISEAEALKRLTEVLSVPLPPASMLVIAMDRLAKSNWRFVRSDTRVIKTSVTDDGVKNIPVEIHHTFVRES